MSSHSRSKRMCSILLDTVEVYIPAIMLMCLFASFIVGIVCRYILRDPQSWTYELSSISFLQFTILSACFVQRKDEHIVFDMIYEKMSNKTKCVMRIVGGVIIAVTATLLIPTSFKYVGTMIGLKTQVIGWPRWCVFVCFPLMFIIIDIRTIIRLFLDLRGLARGKYEKIYPRGDK